MDVFDLIGGGSGSSADPLGMMQGFSSLVSTLLTAMASAVAIPFIAALVIIGVAWAITGFRWLYIGRKAGLDKDWMPFVPIAKTLYRLKIVDEQWWKVFFLEGWWFYGSILSMLILAISSFKWFVFAVILFALYSLACIAYNVYWRYKFFVTFGIKPHLAITILIPFSGWVRRKFDYNIAFTDNFTYGGSSNATSISAGANDIVNVKSSGKGGSISGLSGMYAGQDIPLASNEALLIGRDNTCNLIIDMNADKLSRKHCSITYDATRKVYMVTDFSSNGTYVDGGNRLVANMATQLQSGTVIALGNRENRFRLN